MFDSDHSSEDHSEAINTCLEDLLAYVQVDDRICPNPQEWLAMYELLPARRHGDASYPGLPLILGGWWDSSNAQKRQRLIAQIRYAGREGVLDAVDRYLRSLPDSAWHRGDVSKPVRSWPEYSRHPPSPKPATADVLHALRYVSEQWEGIAGKDLASHTRPVRFTGRKRRRLVVAADPTHLPPWGSWSAILHNPKSFSMLRGAVNSAISPLTVDDIAFITDRWKQLQR